MCASLRALCVALIAATILSCMGGNRVIVHLGKIDDRTPPDVGDDYDFERLPTEGYTQQKPGYYAVHSDQEWLFLWKDPRPDAQPPPPPRGIDYGKKMIFVATATDDDARSIEVQKVMSTYSGLHVYILETLKGPDCPREPSPRPMDIIELDTIPYDVHVHVDRVHADNCGPPPDAVAVCRIAGSGKPGADKITASVGDTIDCDGSKSKPQVGTIIDRSWQLLSVPPGSMTKLAVGKNGMGLTFPVDAWGIYSVGLSIHDAVREGTASVIVDATPPEGSVELYWAHVAPSVDPATLPRVELHVVELPHAVGVAQADCSVSSVKPWCEVHTVAAMQQALVRAEPGKRYRVSIRHLDVRRSAGPVPCIRTFPPHGRASSTCDSEDITRSRGSIWDLGALDPATGTFYDPRLPKPPAPADSSSSPPETAPPAHKAPTPPPTKPSGGTELEL